MDNNNTSQGFQTDRDNNYKEDIVTDKYGNVSKVKPLQFLNHVYKSVLKKNQLPSYFIFYPTSRCNLNCSHCFYHDSLNKRFNELSLAEIDSFTKTMDPLLSLVLTGGEPYLKHDLAQIVNEDGIALRAGHHCAQPLVEKLGVPATTRVSFYVYNDKSDIDKYHELINEKMIKSNISNNNNKIILILQ